jgi:hypothetical protein
VLLIMGLGAQLPMWPEQPGALHAGRHDGMGHDLPGPVWQPILEALTENFARTAVR